LHEIQNGFSLIMAVVQDRRTPHARELLAEPQSPRAAMMFGVLHRCWRYDPKERVSATWIATVVNSPTQNTFQSLIITAGCRAWRSIGTASTHMANYATLNTSVRDNDNEGPRSVWELAMLITLVLLRGWVEYECLASSCSD
jgi:hypothetical protein